MKFAPRRALACLPLLAVFLLVSCQTPAAPAGGPPTSAAGYSLDPANPVFNLEREGMKVAWRQEFGETATGQLMQLYAAGNYVIAQGANRQVLVYDDTDYGTYKGGTVLQGPLQVAPAVTGTKVLLATGNRIYTLDAATDTLSSTALRVGMALSATPLVNQGNLIMVSEAGDIASASMATGNTNWVTSIDGPILNEPVIDNGVVYAAAQLDSAVALKLDNKGTELWRFAPPAPAKFNSGIAVYGKTCYIGDNLGALYGLGTDLAPVMWKKSLGAPVVGEPKVVGDKVLAFTSAPAVACLKGDAGPDVIWTLPGAERLLCAGKKLAYFLMADNSVTAVTIDEGKQVWNDPLPAGTIITGSATRPEFYIANTAGAIVAIAELE